MKPIAWLFKWTLKAAIFFTLFAFALNNQGDVTVRFFFGQKWTAPMVLVVLGAFAIGVLIGVLGMAPRWWRQQRSNPAAVPPAADTPPVKKPQAAPSTVSDYSDSTLHGV